MGEKTEARRRLALQEPESRLREANRPDYPEAVHRRLVAEEEQERREHPEVREVRTRQVSREAAERPEDRRTLERRLNRPGEEASCPAAHRLLRRRDFLGPVDFRDDCHLHAPGYAANRACRIRGGRSFPGEGPAVPP